MSKNNPVKKYYGNIVHQNAKKIINNEKLVTQWQDSKGVTHDQIKIKAAQWADGNISIQVWDAESKESINLAYLRVENQQEEMMITPKVNDDNPF